MEVWEENRMGVERRSGSDLICGLEVGPGGSGEGGGGSGVIERGGASDLKEKGR